MEPVFEAISKGDITRLRFEFFERDDSASINAIRESNRLLDQSATANLIWSFLSVNVNGTNYKGETPLNYAIGSNADLEVINFLLNMPNIDVNKNDTDEGQAFPLYNAVLNNETPLVQKLLQMGADVNNVNSSGFT